MRTFCISGASAGLGLALSKALLEQGHSVIGVGRDFSKADLDYAHFTALQVDLADRQALEAMLATHKDELHSTTDIVINAGYGQFGSLEEFSNEQIQQLMDVNFTHQAMLVKALLPSIKSNSGGKILFMGSESALAGAKFGSIYCASKFALRGFAQALRAECRTQNIAVSIINPGMIASDFFSELSFTHGDAKENAIQIDDVVEVLLHIINTPNTMVLDEINLSPMKTVIVTKGKK